MESVKTYNKQSIDAVFIQSHAGEIKSGRLLQWLKEFREVTPTHIPIRIFLDESASNISKIEELTDVSAGHDIELVFIDDTVGDNPTSVVWTEMINHNTNIWSRVLLLESDCRLLPGYIPALNADMSRFDDWWIYGSLYYGDSTNHFAELNRMTHMNGIAVYNRCYEFINFVNYVFHTSHGIDNAVNFDWLLAQYIHSRGDIYNKFIDSKHIINISPVWDIHVEHAPLKPLAKIIHCKKYIDSNISTEFKIKPISTSPSTERVVLFTTLYNERDVKRFDELKYCLDKNLQNESISEIVVFTEDSPDEMSRYSDNIKIVSTPTRPTYHDMMKHANEYYSGDIIMIANSDIYFDETLCELNKMDMTGKFFSLTRWCVHSNNHAYLPHVRNSSHPIDDIEHEDMISLRWWNASMIEKHIYECDFDKYRERWMSQHDDIEQTYDMQYFDRQMNVKGRRHDDGSTACWRNELSADTWIFKAPYTPLNNQYNIPIGTYRCDTWLNYLLIQQHNKNNIELSNPCLSIKTYHHDFLRTDADKNYDITGDESPPWLDTIIQDSSRDTIVHSCYVPWVRI